ncbi:MAG TPA: hypothetical protein VN088_14915 [Nocardioides sp.]|nr:hypothetical protein [Nocardioides sp.]
MTVDGLPLHPLVVHATVVTLPVTAVLALIYAYRANSGSRLRPRRDEGLRLALMVLAVLCAGLVFLTFLSGDQLAADKGFPASFVHVHRRDANWLRWTTYGFAAVALVVGFLEQRADTLRGLLHALLVVVALAMLVLCVMTGDAGARLVYA